MELPVIALDLCARTDCSSVINPNLEATLLNIWVLKLAFAKNCILLKIP